MSLLTSCSTIHYLAQAGKGQLMLLNRAKPLEEVIQDPRTSKKTAELLKSVPDIKAFVQEHGLNVTQNYSEYVQLDRDAVVYVVTVSEALEFQPKIFSFPIAGTFTYLGWFSKENAQDFAEEYRKEGFDVNVRGAEAYSTLGWFDDPLLSTMMSNLPELVNVVIHESVHASLYINGQSYFNESLASFVADGLTHEYFTRRNLLDSQDWKAYQQNRSKGKVVLARLARAYQDLNAIYTSPDSDEIKLQKKTKYLSALKTEISAKRELNNASLIQYRTYSPKGQGFEELLAHYQGSMRDMMAVLKDLKESDFPQAQMVEFSEVLRKFQK